MTDTRQIAFTDPARLLIQPSPTADTRTCDVATVSEATLGASSRAHIADVRAMLTLLACELRHRAETHDADKLSELAWFHRDFRTKFAETGWWDRHRRIWRHHLGQSDGVPDDVNLIDVLEYVVDCVMAGMARSGSVYPLVIEDDVLRRAFANTQAQLTALVEVEVTRATPEE